jgi:hypothetical protein
MDYPTFRNKDCDVHCDRTDISACKLTYSQADIIDLVFYTKKLKYIAHQCNLLQTLSVPHQSKLTKSLLIQQFH